MRQLHTAESGRWGDYTAVAADPGGSSSWTLAQYAVDQSDYQMSSAHLISAATPSGCRASTVGVTICTPTAGSTVNSPVKISAASKGNHTILAIKAYANGKLVASSSSGLVNAKVSLTKNTYSLVVNAWDWIAKILSVSPKAQQRVRLF